MKLLIADDEATIRRGMEKMIASFPDSYEIITACDGLDALEQIKDHRPELILADINMPHVNGLEMIARARQLVPNSKIIIVSGYHEFEYAQKAMQLQVTEYLLKPVKEIQLRQVLSQAAKAYRRRVQELQCLGLLEPGESKDVIAQMIEEMKGNLSDETLSLQSMSDRLHMSQSSLSKGLKQKVGMGFSDYLNVLRLEKAKLLLLRPDKPTVLEVSIQCGFASQHYFCRVFKQMAGVSPTKYRNGMEEESKKK